MIDAADRTRTGIHLTERVLGEDFVARYSMVRGGEEVALTEERSG